MDRKTLEERVLTLVTEKLGLDPGEVAVESSFVDDLKTDSLDLVDLIMAFEEEFDLEIPDKDAESIVCVKDVIDYLAAKVR